MTSSQKEKFFGIEIDTSNRQLSSIKNFFSRRHLIIEFEDKELLISEIKVNVSRIKI